MRRKGADVVSLLKLQDMIDVLNALNRIKDNSYDQEIYDNLNDMNFRDKAESIMRHISKNTDGNTRQNAEIFIDILRNIDMLNNNQYNKNKKRYYMGRNLSYGQSDLLDKIKFFLKSLNDEE